MNSGVYAKCLIAACFFTITACAPDSGNAPSIQNSDSAAPLGDSEAELDLAKSGKNYFFSFARTKDTDDDSKAQFATQQTQLVNDSIAALNKGSFKKSPFTIETELNPKKSKQNSKVMSIERYQNKLREFQTKVGSEDTVVIYTHTHGSFKGSGLNWDQEITDFEWAALATEINKIQAKNVIVFNMSCHSGALAFKLTNLLAASSKSTTKRNLIVLTPVAKDQLAICQS